MPIVINLEFREYFVDVDDLQQLVSVVLTHTIEREDKTMTNELVRLVRFTSVILETSPSAKELVMAQVPRLKRKATYEGICGDTRSYLGRLPEEDRHNIHVIQVCSIRPPLQFLPLSS